MDARESKLKANAWFVGRRYIDWSKLKTLHGQIVFWIATAGGAGLFPFAPGTAGSVAGLPLAFYTQGFAFWPRVGFWAFLTVIASYAAWQIDEMMGTADNQNIVVDEVIGMGITAWTAGESWLVWATAFFLFRFFDVLKIPPVRQIDRWSKKRTHAFWNGFGVIADDIVAGFQGLAVILALQEFGFFEKLQATLWHLF